MESQLTEYRGIKRIRQACANCRRKKTRCPGERPICSFCARLKQECVYESTDEHRSSNNLSSVDAEDLLSRVAFLESQLRSMNSTEPTSDGNSLATLRQHESARPKNKEQQEPPRRHSGRDGSSPLLDLPGSVTAPDLQTQIVAMEVYFQRCHNQPYCYFNEVNFRQRLLAGEIPSCLVLAMMASAARFSQHTTFHDDSDEQLCSALARASWAEILKSSLASDDSWAIHLVQATNLLATIDFTSGRMRQSWVKVGLAIRFAQDLHMTSEPDSALSTKDQEEWRRVFWSVYLLDRLVSCGRNRPLNFRDDDCLIKLPCSETAFRSGAEETSSMPTISHVFERPDDYIGHLDYFALVVLAASCLGQTARFMLHQTGDNQHPLWSPRSEFAVIFSKLLNLELLLDANQLPISEVVRIKLSVNGAVDQQRVGHLLYSRGLYHLSMVLLNHPFLLRQRLKASKRKVPSTFLREAFQRCVEHAEAITKLLDEARACGCQVEASFYAFFTIVSGTVHCLYAHSESSSERGKARVLLLSGTSFLRGLSQTWPHYAKVPVWSPHDDSTNNVDLSLWWHALDYSSLCGNPTTPTASGSSPSTSVGLSKADPASPAPDVNVPNLDAQQPDVFYAQATDFNINPAEDATIQGQEGVTDWMIPPGGTAVDDPDLLWQFVFQNNMEAPAIPYLPDGNLWDTYPTT